MKNLFKPLAIFNIRRYRLWGILFALMVPTLVSTAVFGYFPKLDVIVKSLFRWRPPEVNEFIGFDNFVYAFSDPLFWQSFQLIGILLVANLVKMWPSIFAAVAIHRLKKAKHRYFYQVCLVIPMVVPGIVMLLIWKSFYDPEVGILNKFLNVTGLMDVLAFLDGTKEAPGLMPKIAAALDPVMNGTVNLAAGGAGGMVLIGLCLYLMGSWYKVAPGRQQKAVLVLLGASGVAAVAAVMGAFQNILLLVPLVMVLTVLFISLSRQLGKAWIAWAGVLLVALIINRFAPLYTLVIMAIVALIWWIVSRRSESVFSASDMFGKAGLLTMVIASILLFLTQVWDSPTGQFISGKPGWLGSEDLVIPAILLWGFPWVGTFGVLIYLAGLQNISQDVYEAAELDGVGPWGMLFRIELPLIMTQVRINLIFMTIGTLTGYEFFLLLLGTSGGPGNKGLVPGLYLFQQAFEQGNFGYACALGMILFFIVLGLTMIYNRYVKVEK